MAASTGFAGAKLEARLMKVSASSSSSSTASHFSRPILTRRLQTDAAVLAAPNISALEQLKTDRGIVALGKFDALHIGHRELAIQASKVGPQFLLSFVGMAEVLGWEPRESLRGFEEVMWQRMRGKDDNQNEYTCQNIKGRYYGTYLERNMDLLGVHCSLRKKGDQAIKLYSESTLKRNVFWKSVRIRQPTSTDSPAQLTHQINSSFMSIL